MSGMALRERNDITATRPLHRADRAGRFMARVDAHLATLSGDGERRAFLDRQVAGWEHRYARFLASEGASEFTADPRDPPHAADFLLTIGALAARRLAEA